jgi:hypothetical protein
MDTNSLIDAAPTLLVIRGNSASGKTTAAREARRRFGRGAAVVEQDYFRRVVLREHGGIGTDAVAPGSIDMCVRHLLGAGYHVIVEGILHTGSYGPMLRQLIGDHLGPSHAFYLDVGFEETVRRRHNRAEPIPVTAAQMLDWYAEHDVLGVDGEHVIPETATLEHAVATVLDTSGLVRRAPLTPCPVRCLRCAAKQATSDAQPAVTGCHDEVMRGETQ